MARRTKAKPNKPKSTARKAIDCKTHDGHKLTPQEAKFIDNYIATGNGAQSVVEAGYKSKSPRGYAYTLLTKAYIKSEIEYRLEQHKAQSIAEADEILQYFTSVMRGEVKDQFGLEASLGERTKAAQELAKRKIDMVNRVTRGSEGTAEVRITLDWGNEGSEEQ